jgi:hypothetical protein
VKLGWEACSPHFPCFCLESSRNQILSTMYLVRGGRGVHFQRHTVNSFGKCCRAPTTPPRWRAVHCLCHSAGQFPVHLGSSPFWEVALQVSLHYSVWHSLFAPVAMQPPLLRQHALSITSGGTGRGPGGPRKTLPVSGVSGHKPSATELCLGDPDFPGSP